MELNDWRTRDWILFNSPVLILAFIFSYLYFVLKCGPKFMENRQPYSLKNIIKLYNVFQIVSNALYIYHILDVGWYQDYFFKCVPADITKNPRSMKIALLAWYLLVIKLIDYVETGFFILRKKQRQVSFLHLYHHVSTVIVAWLSGKYGLTGMALTIPLINCGIHVIMYSYYLAASYGPRVQRYLAGIKPVITMLQMVQFVVLIVYLIQAFIPGCPGVRFISGVLLVNLSINFYLFYQFYQENYVKNKKQS